MRKVRNFERIMLIVCEGTSTEPQYFEWLRDNIALPKKIWDKIDVSSNTILPDEVIIPKKGEVGGKRKTRPLKFENTNKRIKKSDLLKDLWEYVYGIDVDTEKYEDISAQPLRYVAQAQCLHEHSNVYDEIWAVFDKDGHSAHKEAFDRSEKLVKNIKTNIAFSSRSFEHWILLHFEENNRTFDLTECKVDRKPLGCNLNIGCKGEKCLIGYIRSQYYPNFQKSNNNFNLENLMAVLVSKHEIAFKNAAWLKNQHQSAIQNGSKVYELTPYTDMDKLVRRIISV